ncbi:MAG: sigma-70 family RNA polymerase sigma factor [Candidatus Uhrbacteria bacterium]
MEPRIFTGVSMARGGMYSVENSEFVHQFTPMSSVEFRENFRAFKEAENAYLGIKGAVDALVLEGKSVSATKLTKLERCRETRDEHRNRLVVANMRYVMFVCKTYEKRGTDYADVVQEGVFGLLRALETYDPDRGAFTTYADWWIRSFARRGAQRQSNKRAMHVSVGQQEIEYGVMRDVRAFKEKHGVSPTDEELRSFTKRTRIVTLNPRALSLVRANPQVGSSESIHTFDSERYERQLKSQAPTPEMIVAAKQQFAKLRAEIFKIVISPDSNEPIVKRNDAIMKMRFGLSFDKAPMTLVEIGDIFGVTRERIRQLIAQRLKRHELELGKFDAMVEDLFDLFEVLSSVN